jgi:hypothetical protein
MKLVIVGIDVFTWSSPLRAWTIGICSASRGISAAPMGKGSEFCGYRQDRFDIKAVDRAVSLDVSRRDFGHQYKDIIHPLARLPNIGCREHGWCR